jgi:hypothetical protein
VVGRPWVTHATPEWLAWAEAVGGERNAERVERLGHRRTSRAPIAPLLVKQNDHSEGLTSLLTLGVRGLTGTGFGLRRARAPATLPGLPPEHKRKRTGPPTAERLLHAFAGVALTIIQSATGEESLRRMTP